VQGDRIRDFRVGGHYVKVEARTQLVLAYSVMLRKIQSECTCPASSQDVA
jgi:hypothetical protein